MKRVNTRPPEFGSKLDPKFKRRWVKALRSGKYKQGHGQLKDVGSNTYCCLGVAAEVYYGKRMAWQNESEIDGSVSFCVVPIEGAQNALIDLNDGTNYSNGTVKTPRRGFKYIATWIEKYL